MTRFWEICPLDLNFLPGSILRELFSPNSISIRSQFTDQTLNENELKCKIPIPSNPSNTFFYGKHGYYLLLFQPIRFRAKWTSDSSIQHRKTRKNAFSRKLDFYWFLTLPPFCAPSPPSLEKITLRFGFPTIDNVSSILWKISIINNQFIINCWKLTSGSHSSSPITLRSNFLKN